jgi:MFS family permease
VSPSAPAAGAFATLDESQPTRFQRKILLVSDMGFVTDAYDLFVIGIVVKIVTTQWHLSSTQTSLPSSTTLAASAVGAIVFGRVADMLGRKKMYGYEVLILAAGAIASAFSPNITWLIVFRIILGIGVIVSVPPYCFRAWGMSLSAWCWNATPDYWWNSPSATGTESSPGMSFRSTGTMPASRCTSSRARRCGAPADT